MGQALITPQFVIDLFSELLNQAMDLPGSWSVTPKTVTITARKGTFGEAASDGTVMINPGFIGTTAHNKLRQTILHELAHLKVGLKQSHNKYWQHTARMLGMSFDSFEDEEQMVMAKIAYKYTVIAHLVNGQSQNLGQVHRKTARWANYPNGKTRDRTKEGVEVLRYEFIENNS